MNENEHNLLIRPESQGDLQAIRQLLSAAFRQDDETHLVERLKKSAEFIPELSFVAIVNDQIVGYILFPAIAVEPIADFNAGILALAPMAVDPAWQNRGVGSAMVKHGLEHALQLGYRAVVVLGHPEYYPKFGFRPASHWGIRPPIEVPDEAFLALELVENGLKGISGIVRYPRAFRI